MSLLDFQQQPEMVPETFEGTVADDATAPGEPVRVIAPGFDRQLAYGPCAWTPIVTSTGIFWPKRGDSCTIVEPPAGQPVIVSWSPRAVVPDQLITGEKGEKGDTGATGPTGPEGPQGPAGATPLYVSSLPGSPHDGQEVYLVDGTIDRHLRFNGSSWRPVVGKHASAHGAAGSDPMATASLDPTVLTPSYSVAFATGSVTVSSTSSPGTTLTGAAVVVKGGTTALLLAHMLGNVPGGTDYEFAIFSGASGGSYASTRGYVSNRTGSYEWRQVTCFGFVSPAVDTTYRLVSWRDYGTINMDISTGAGTTLAQIVLGGSP